MLKWETPDMVIRCTYVSPFRSASPVTLHLNQTRAPYANVAGSYLPMSRVKGDSAKPGFTVAAGMYLVKVGVTE